MPLQHRQRTGHTFKTKPQPGKLSFQNKLPCLGNITYGMMTSGLIAHAGQSPPGTSAPPGTHGHLIVIKMKSSFHVQFLTHNSHTVYKTLAGNLGQHSPLSTRVCQLLAPTEANSSPLAFCGVGFSAGNVGFLTCHLNSRYEQKFSWSCFLKRAANVSSFKKTYFCWNITLHQVKAIHKRDLVWFSSGWEFLFWIIASIWKSITTNRTLTSRSL